MNCGTTYTWNVDTICYVSHILLAKGRQNGPKISECRSFWLILENQQADFIFPIHLSDWYYRCLLILSLLRTMTDRLTICLLGQISSINFLTVFCYVKVNGWIYKKKETHKQSLTGNNLLAYCYGMAEIISVEFFFIWIEFFFYVKDLLRESSRVRSLILPCPW